MNNKKYIQPQQFQTSLPKSSAITRVEDYVNTHVNEFKDGEIVSIQYLAEDNTTAQVTAVIHIINNTTKISAQLSEKDTVKIVASEDEPQDTESLWLTDITSGDTSGETSNLRQEIKQLKQTIAYLQQLVLKHDYALSNTLAGGDIIVNSEKFDLENKYEHEKPEDAEDPVDWAEEDFVITTFEPYIANSPLSEFLGNASLYKGEKYYITYKFYNKSEERVPDEYANVVEIVNPTTIAEIRNHILYAATSGECDIHITVSSTGGDILSKDYYGIKFKYNEEPDYPIYEEPNVHHMLIKHADSAEIMMQNSDLLLVGEFCWCINENTLYLKEKAANGSIQLFKINGNGSITPSSATITYYVDENGIFNADSSDGSIFVDENGIVNFVGVVDENGIFWADSQSGYTPTPTPPEPEPSGETVTIVVDSNGTLDIESTDGSAHVTTNNALILPTPIMVNNDGMLIL